MNKTKEICTAKGLGIADFGNVLKIVTENLKKIHAIMKKIKKFLKFLKRIMELIEII